jgi:hypothetical protein
MSVCGTLQTGQASTLKGTNQGLAGKVLGNISLKDVPAFSLALTLALRPPGFFSGNGRCALARCPPGPRKKERLTGLRLESRLLPLLLLGLGRQGDFAFLSRSERFSGWSGHRGWRKG